ncbi:MAG: peroxiredoxin [Gemmataceae bacterium]|nr:peroxiredoxin [Gemmataceae bacterium]
MVRFASLPALLGLCLATASADDSTLKVKVGDKFPDVPLKAAQVDKLPGKKAGDSLSIADLKGKTVIVFFYPKADTPGCTAESCGFRDLTAKFPKDVVLIGASTDDVLAQQAFIKKFELPMPLLADTEAKLVKDLGIVNAKNGRAQRVTFVVGPDGTITNIFPTVKDAKAHPQQVLDSVTGKKGDK